MANIAGPTTPTGTDLDTTEDETKDFVNRFAPVTSLPFADYRGGIEVAAADGGRIGYAGGGITGLRQGYFLGKLVRKATKAVKKVVKSPVGKAALAYAAYNYGPQLLSGKGLKLGDITKFRNLTMKNINPMRFIGLTSLLPFLMPQEDEQKNLDAVAASRAGDVNPFDQYGGVTGLRRKVLAGNLDPAEFPFMNPTYYAADGGRIGFANGGNDDEDETVRSQALGALYSTERPKFSDGGAGLPPITAGIEGQVSQSFPDDETPAPTQQDQMPRPMPNPMMMAGRMNPMMARQMNPMMARQMNPMMSMQPRMMAQDGGIMMASAILGDESDDISMELYGKPVKDLSPGQLEDLIEYLDSLSKDFVSAPSLMARPRVMAQEGGLMDMGGMEKDYRNEGGFVPIGGQERADDVPARLSKNEFVFTADAVRNAGGGDIDKGAEIMENMMENLEKGGKVSEESQGLKGARDMFATAQRLEGVL